MYGGVDVGGVDGFNGVDGACFTTNTATGCFTGMFVIPLMTPILLLNEGGTI